MINILLITKKNLLTLTPPEKLTRQISSYQFHSTLKEGIFSAKKKLLVIEFGFLKCQYFNIISCLKNLLCCGVLKILENTIL